MVDPNQYRINTISELKISPKKVRFTSEPRYMIEAKQPFWGEFGRTSKWVQRQSSVYTMRPRNAKKTHVGKRITSENTSVNAPMKINENAIKLQQTMLKPPKSQNESHPSNEYLQMRRGESSSGLETSIDTQDLDIAKEATQRNKAKGEKEIGVTAIRDTVLLQDFIMLTDIFPVPHLLSLM